MRMEKPMGLRKPVNLTMDCDLLAEAKQEKIQLSAVAEKAVRAELASIRTERWKRENADAIREANDELAQNGLWSDGLRLF
jgi:antitoxin CcdA